MGHTSRIFFVDNEFVRERVLDLLGQVQLPKEVVISQPKSIRRSAQNRLYWSIVGEIANATGKPNNVIHEYLKQTFLGFTEHNVNGYIFNVGNSTATLSVKEFAEYVERVMQWQQEILQ